MKVVCSDRKRTVYIESRTMSYLITRDREYLCVVVSPNMTICVTLDHRSGKVIVDLVHLDERGEITEVETWCYSVKSRRGREILREFEILAEILLDSACIASKSST